MIEWVVEVWSVRFGGIVARRTFDSEASAREWAREYGENATIYTRKAR